MKMKNENILILGVGHPRTGTGYTAKLLNQWGLVVGHENFKKNGTVDWSLSAGKNSLWQYLSFEDCNWDHIIYPTRNPKESVPSILYTENLNKSSLDFRKNNASLTEKNPLSIAIDSLYKWDDMIEKLINPSFTYRIEDQGEKLFEYLKNNGVDVKWSEESLGKKYNIRKHPSWDVMVKKFGPISEKDLRKLNNYCKKFGYPEL